MDRDTTAYTEEDLARDCDALYSCFKSTIAGAVECLFPWLKVGAVEESQPLVAKTTCPYGNVATTGKPAQFDRCADQEPLWPTPPSFHEESEVPTIQLDLPSIFHEFLCPLSKTLPVDPVLAPDGYIYERGETLKSTKNSTVSFKSPVTGERLWFYQLSRSSKRIEDIQEAVNKIKSGEVVASQEDLQLVVEWERRRESMKTMNERVQSLLPQAEEGDLTAMEALGIKYLNGVGGYGKDPEKAYYWNKKAADAGGVNSMALAGDELMFRENLFVSQDMMLATYLLSMGAAQDPGSDVACILLSKLFSGDRKKYAFPQDQVQALRFLKLGLQRESTVRNLSASDIENAKKRMPDLEKSTAKESIDSKSIWKEYKHHSSKVPPYRKLTESEKVQAMEDLGLKYRNGLDGFRKDAKKGYEWNKRAADAGSIRGMAHAGEHLLKIELEDEFAKDRAWHVLGASLLAQAAAGGSQFACILLGEFFALGTYGFPKDKAQAILLLRAGTQSKRYAHKMSDRFVENAKQLLKELEGKNEKDDTAKKSGPVAKYGI